MPPPVRKPKLPLDYVLRQMHDVMELIFAYDHDPSFVPNADQLVLFELIEKQFASYSAMLLSIARTMRGRAREAGL